jgi:processive 1,2-diacylglycerol beta-glucosyltransferase
MKRRRADRRTRLILASSSVGAGHNTAAAAIMAALKTADPAIRAEFTDALAFVPWWFRLTYAGIYTLGMTKVPRLYGVGYGLLGRTRGPRRILGERVRLSVERWALRSYQQHLLRRRPVLVLATHYLASPTVGWMVGRGVKGIRLWAMVTDHQAHRFYYAENVEKYFVANEQVRDQLAGWGVQPGRVVISGIPIHPKWTEPLNKAEVRRKWKLPDRGHIVLLSGGAYFTVGPVQQIAEGILAASEAHVVILAGANKKLLARLAGLSQSTGRVTAVPFTDRVHELVEVASLVVTKPGGLITTECTARGAAMVLTRPVPGQEAANAALLVGRGAGVRADSTDQVIREVTALLAAPAKLRFLRGEARRLYKPATQTIASHIVQAIGH